MAVVKTRPATTAGEQIPSPTSADQRTFFVGENSTGSDFFEVATPVQFGPRHCGQSSASAEPAAAFAIELFIHRLVRECGALTACLGGLDLLAFTGGIGEHDAVLRSAACRQLAFLGVKLDEAANLRADGNAVMAIHAPDSSVELWVVPTDEGRIAAADAAALLPH